jgi:hypothetical protein
LRDNHVATIMPMPRRQIPILIVAPFLSSSPRYTCGQPTRYSSKKQGDTPCRLAYEKNAERYGLTRDNNEVVLGPLPDRPVGSHAPARLAVARQNPQDRPVLTKPGRKADAEEIGHQTARQEALRFSLICSARLAIPGSQGPDWRMGLVAACAARRTLAPSGGSIRGWPRP